MFKSGWLLIGALLVGSTASASLRPNRAFDHLLTPDPEISCAIRLERLGTLRSAVEALPMGDEGAAYVEATMYAPTSPLLQATLRDEKKITDPTALDLRAHGYSLSIDYVSNRLALIHDGKRLHRWTLTQPLAEVRFNETADHRLEFALVGWISTEYYLVERDQVTRSISPSDAIRVPANWLWITREVAEIFGIPYDETRAADRNSAYYSKLFRSIYDRDVRISAWVPERPHRDPSEDVARLHELSRRPRPASYLKQAMAELTVELLDRARAICERRTLPGPIFSRTYPNQLLGLAADRLRSNHSLLESLATTINDLDEGEVRVTALPRPAEEPIADDGRDLLVVKLLGCTPLTFSIPADPIGGPRGWGVLR